MPPAMPAACSDIRYLLAWLWPANMPTTEPTGTSACDGGERKQCYKQSSHSRQITRQLTMPKQLLSRGSSRRIHCGVEVTELSTNKQHTLSRGVTVWPRDRWTELALSPVGQPLGEKPTQVAFSPQSVRTSPTCCASEGGARGVKADESFVPQ